MDIYSLSRNFWDYSFENPDKLKPNHAAIYFFAIENCNRLGWKEKFGLPTTMTMEAVGIKNYKTYHSTLMDLIDFGFIKLIEKSKNQYSSNVIALVNNTKANTKALTKAMSKHDTKQIPKQVQSIVSIDILDYFNTILPNYQYTDFRVDLIKKWLFYKIEKKEKYTKLGFEAFLNKWDKLDDSKFEEMVLTAMASNWKGLFLPKENKPSNNSEPAPGKMTKNLLQMQEIHDEFQEQIKNGTYTNPFIRKY
jgi:hypothetical protein